MGMFFILYLTGCHTEPYLKNNNQDIQTPANSTDKDSTKVTTKLTIEKIIERYTEEDLGKFVKTYDYKNYILVEYLNPAGYQCFDLYNLETGDRDVMMLGNNAQVFNFSSGDTIEFKSDGTHQMSGHKYFPYYAVYTRAEEITESENDFHYVERELYLPINEDVEFGVKDCEIVSDFKVTLTGLELEFATQKGKETEFYAGNIDIPVMKTSYDQNKNQFTIELINTSIDRELLRKVFIEQDRYINSVQFKEKGSNSLVIINLKDMAKYYTAEIDHAEGFPYVKFTFSSFR